MTGGAALIPSKSGSVTTLRGARFQRTNQPVWARWKRAPQGNRGVLGQSLIFALLLVACATLALATEPGAAVRVIFDTDIQGDVDDVGAVAVLHALADLGEVRILATGVSAKNPHSPACLDALNTYFGRPDLPLGVVKGPGFLRDSKYAKQIADEFPHWLKSAQDAPDAAIVYRKVLAAEEDKGVVMISVGPVTNMSNLLKTGADQYSNLSGKELVRRKVSLWVCMGAKIPEGREANIFHDAAASQNAVSNWPTPIVFSGFEIGKRVKTGGALKRLPATSPVRRSYQLYNGIKPHFSWDQTAVLYAARGPDGGLDDHWGLVTQGRLEIDDDGNNTWQPSPDSDHAYLVEKGPPSKIAAIIEGLMLRVPNGSRK
jgi:purine nucleosidase